MNHKIISSVLIGFVALAACTQTPNKQPDTINNLSVGVVGVTSLGIGLDSNSGQIRPAAALADSAVTFITPGTYQNISNTGNTDNFITATFQITANQAFDNLTLYAVAKSTNIGGTALNTILDFGNNPIISATDAQKVKPTHTMQNDTTTVDANKADLQFFHISEAALASQQARTAGYIANTDEVLEYGYVARRCTANCATATPTWTRAFASGDTGEVTIALKMPKGATAANDPYRFRMSFVIANEPVMRFTRSIEEGTVNTTNVVTRASGIAGAKEIAFRGGPNAALSGCASCTKIQFDNIKISTAPIYIVTPVGLTYSGTIKVPYVTSSSPEALGIPKEAEFVEGQAIVKFKSSAIGAAAARTLAVDNQEPLYGSTVVLTAQNTPATNGIDGIQAESPVAVDTLNFIAQLRTRADVEWAVPNYIDRAHITTPNDPLYPVQTTATSPNNIWHYGMAKINSAWDTTTGTPNVRVAVLDTGILYNKADYIGNDTNSTQEPSTNPDLYCSTNKWRPGYDFVSYSTAGTEADTVDDDDPYDLGPYSGTSFHGTHVAGTIGACTNNTTGIAGIGWGVEMMAVRVLGPSGGQRSDIIRGMLWAAGIAVSTTTSSGTSNITNPFPADVLNMSLGGLGTDQSYQDAIDQINAAGKIVVVSAGNSNDDASKYAPAGQNGVITVGSVGPTATVAKRSYFSNFGTSVEITGSGGDSLSAVSPNQVLSTQGCNANGQGQPSPTTGCTTWGYGQKQGTSMSAPHVAGIIALMNSARLAQAIPLPKLNVYEATYYLQTTASVLNAANDCAKGCGAGLVDAQAAVNGAIGNGFPGAFLQFKNAFNAGLPGLNLSTSAITGDLTLENMTATTGNFTITTSNAFLSATVSGSTTGTLAGNATTTVNVTLNRTGLADGAYVGSIIATVGLQSTTAPVYYIQGTASNPSGRLMIEARQVNVAGNAFITNPEPVRIVMNWVEGQGYVYRFTGILSNTGYAFRSLIDTNYDGFTEYFSCYPSPGSSCTNFDFSQNFPTQLSIILGTSVAGFAATW